MPVTAYDLYGLKQKASNCSTRSLTSGSQVDSGSHPVSTCSSGLPTSYRLPIEKGSEPLLRSNEGTSRHITGTVSGPEAPGNRPTRLTNTRRSTMGMAGSILPAPPPAPSPPPPGAELPTVPNLDAPHPHTVHSLLAFGGWDPSSGSNRLPVASNGGGATKSASLERAKKASHVPTASRSRAHSTGTSGVWFVAKAHSTAGFPFERPQLNKLPSSCSLPGDASTNTYTQESTPPSSSEDSVLDHLPLPLCASTALSRIPPDQRLSFPEASPGTRVEAMQMATQQAALREHAAQETLRTRDDVQILQKTVANMQRNMELVMTRQRKP